MSNLEKNKEKGITLIALVVTIVVLIILATVSIITVLGDNGIIARAEKAKDMYKNSMNQEKKAMNELLEQYENEIVESTVLRRGKVIYNIDIQNSKIQEYNFGENVLNPSFTPEKEGYTFFGWKEDLEAGKNILNSRLMSENSISLYAVFKKDVTLSYNANGGTSTPDSQIEQLYYNNGNILNPTFTLSTAITKSNYLFKNWAIGSTSGDKYKALDSITIDTDTTFFAIWESNDISRNNNLSGGWYGSGNTWNGTRQGGLASNGMPLLFVGGAYGYTVNQTMQTNKLVDLTNINSVVIYYRYDSYINCTQSTTLYILDSSGKTVKSTSDSDTRGSTSDPYRMRHKTFDTKDLSGEYKIKVVMKIVNNESSDVANYQFLFNVYLKN